MKKKPLIKHISNKLITDALIIDNIMHQTEDTIFFKDKESRFILHDSAHLYQFNVDNPNELIGKTDFDFFPKDSAAIKRNDEIQIMETGIPILNKIEKSFDEKGKPMIFSTSKYPLYDTKGNIIGTWGTSRNVTKLVKTEKALEKANRKLKELTITDNLTNLYNQRHFYTVIGTTIQMYKRRKNQKLVADFSLIFIDVDHLKNINDTYGHLVGDLALKHVASVLRKNTRTTDMVFRYGGDEFAVILYDANHQDAISYANHIINILHATPLQSNQETLHITISCGVASYMNENSPNELISKSDEQLYKAKTAGRNTVM